MQHSSPALHDILASLYHPKLKTIDLSLGRVERFLTLLGNPEQHLPPVIHIAGTNGKGSLVANLRAMYEAAGKRVHAYISPHLVKFNERITLAGQEISDDALLELLREVQKASEQEPVTFFEATTAAALLAFARAPADAVLLETGMGGRLDATNVIARPALTAITPVSIDHAEYLGDTLGAIAGEKAGIIKPAVPCVIGPQLPEAQAVLERIASERAAPFFLYGREWSVEPDNGGQAFCYRSAGQVIAMPPPALPGVHQWWNAATALACMEMLSRHAPSLAVPEAAQREGIASARWPARLQRLQQGPLVELAASYSPHTQLWLDGGHNPSAGQALAEWLKHQKQQQPALRILLLCGMVKGKDSMQFLAPLAPWVENLAAITIPDEALSQPADAIEIAARQVGIPAFSAPSVQQAAARLLENPSSSAEASTLLLICGSLYLAGKILENHC
jgi:dihydrofolate synthase/folylpolyglutamate synthase